MEVSVIIPVYNAEKYVSHAIDSALAQEEVGEVILIEDNSPDQALRICESYAARDSRVKLLRHPGGVNRGAGASRNLGIKHASKEFIAFLDADDQFVPNRFKTAKEIFSTSPDADGVYGHIGTMYYDKQYATLHLSRTGSEITGMREYVVPEQLLSYLLRGNRGHISVDSLVVRRKILTDTFLFDVSLLQGQDTDFMYRLCSKHRLYAPKEVDIVALRGVHAENRVFRFAEAAKFRQQLLLKCINNNFYDCNDREVALAVIRRYLDRTAIRRLPLIPLRIKRFMALSLFLVTHPTITMGLIRIKPMRE